MVEASAEGEDGLTTLEALRLSAANLAYSVSRALRLDRVAALLQRSHISPDSPVWLVGRCYTAPDTGTEADRLQVLADLLRHLRSILWMTYRTNFAALGVGDVQLTTDAGWGCTLRSAQMIMAQAMQRHMLPPDWRWPLDPRLAPASTAKGEAPPPAAADADGPPPELRQLLRLFWDQPTAASTFSLHNICKQGAHCGVFPGRWLGPWTACRALEAAAAAAEAQLGLRVAVVAAAGGGAPWLNARGFDQWWEGDAGRGLLLLVPLVLGLGKLNAVYLPQLQGALATPQSVGIVGGLPRSSLYFIGVQGENVLYLDPHQVQEAACSDGDCDSFRCDVLRTLPLPSIDPSLALGFYCGSAGEYEDLCARLAALEAANPGAPLVCVRGGPEPGPDDHAHGGEGWASDELEDEGGEGEGCADGDGLTLGGEGATKGAVEAEGGQAVAESSAGGGLAARQTSSKSGWELL